MANRRTTFGKLERDKAKRARAAAKRERRQDRTADEPEDGVVDVRSTPTVPQDQVIERLQQLHERFESGVIDFEQFEEEKDSLLSLLAPD